MADASALTTNLDRDQAISFVMGSITHENNWNTVAGQAPAGWNNYGLAAVIRIVATVMVKLELGEYVVVNLGKVRKTTLQQVYDSGFKTAHLTKGYHQRQNLFCFALQGTFNICHLTFRLYNNRGSAYHAVHIYVTSDGRIGGATLWNEQTNQAVS